MDDSQYTIRSVENSTLDNLNSRKVIDILAQKTFQKKHQSHPYIASLMELCSHTSILPLNEAPNLE